MNNCIGIRTGDGNHRLPVVLCIDQDVRGLAKAQCSPFVLEPNKEAKDSRGTVDKTSRMGKRIHVRDPGSRRRFPSPLGRV